MTSTSLFRLLLTAGLILGSSFAHGQERKRVVAYVPNWIDLPEFAKTIDYDKVTHINIAFENPKDDSGELSFNPRNEELIRRAKAAKVKVLMSIGGGSASTNEEMKARYDKLMGEAGRKQFAEKLVAYLEAHKLDGIDVDLEGPAITDNYGGFMAELSAATKAKKLLLTAALSKGYGGDHVPDSVLGQLDFLNIMAYDATGTWDPNRHGQHSSMEFAKEATKYWTGRGLEKSKAVLGVPFYGYGFGNAFRKSGYSYADVVAQFPEGHTVDQSGETIWYNGIPTIQAKSKLVMDEGYGGVMIWSLDQDVKGEKSLLAAIDGVLQPKKDGAAPKAK
ncbi:glycosyl hydrolase family 18 protein [Haloferula sp. BvORR071]|uniref:glycosyl hydrolase family 18 protein n=1 Tax=Haloferula sp. BvORR071 TaxID=1396141 RepID=UPI000695A4EC|nr:glycosyl hydrolase family 18 protein [Haloferula sp. BvORR071]